MDGKYIVPIIISAFFLGGAIASSIQKSYWKNEGCKILIESTNEY